MAEIIVHDKSLENVKRSEWKHGLRPDGSIIGKYAGPEYAVMKSNMNPLANGNVDLILTGSFSSKLFTIRKSTHGYLFRSTDSKTGELLSKYNKKTANDHGIMGLNPETFEEMQRKFYAPLLIRKIKNYARL